MNSIVNVLSHYLQNRDDIVTVALGRPLVDLVSRKTMGRVIALERVEQLENLVDLGRALIIVNADILDITATVRVARVKQSLERHNGAFLLAISCSLPWDYRDQIAQQGADACLGLSALVQSADLGMDPQVN